MTRLLKAGALVAALVHWLFLAPKRSSGLPDRSANADAPATTKKHFRKRLLFDLTLLVGALALGGFLLVVSGVVSIKASSGHWPITAWFLQFAKQRSVSTHALFVPAPVMDDEALLTKGAGHFEIACRPCHGSPQLRTPRVASKMTPHPPYLAETVRRWNRPELFYIVKHGIKFTGMPAWPAQQRDDEVWAMVAFLVRLPHISAQEYLRLTRGELAEEYESAPIESLSGREETPEGVLESCGRCHGVHGRGRRPDSIPILAGQSATYMENALRAFASGQRQSGIMEPVAAALADDSLRELASYYSRIGGLAAGSRADSAAPGLKRGELIAQKGIPAARVPACADCHGPGSAPRSEAYPILAGQHAEYLILQLELLRDQRRGGSPYVHIMHEVAPQLTTEQIRDVATYYESLGKTAGHR